MNIFSNAAVINWQITSPKNNKTEIETSNLTLGEYLKIAHNILDANPLIVNIKNYNDELENEILEEILKTIYNQKKFIKYDLGMDLLDLHKIKSLKDYFNVLVLRVYDDNDLYKLDELVELIGNVELEINYILNSLNKDKLQKIIGKLAIYPNIKVINIIQEKFVNPYYDKACQLTRAETNEIMIEITEVSTDYLEEVHVIYRDINSEIKNLSKNRQIQFAMTVKSNGDIALNEVFNIRSGNALKDKMSDIWQSDFKDFWFNDKTKHIFLEFNSLEDEEFLYLTNNSDTILCSQLLSS